MSAEKDDEQPEGSQAFAGDPEVPTSSILVRSDDGYPGKGLRGSACIRKQQLLAPARCGPNEIPRHRPGTTNAGHELPLRNNGNRGHTPKGRLALLSVDALPIRL
jgi:hypothetical protein